MADPPPAPCHNSVSSFPPPLVSHFVTPISFFASCTLHCERTDGVFVCAPSEWEGVSERWLKKKKREVSASAGKLSNFFRATLRYTRLLRWMRLASIVNPDSKLLPITTFQRTSTDSIKKKKKKKKQDSRRSHEFQWIFTHALPPHSDSHQYV